MGFCSVVGELTDPGLEAARKASREWNKISLMSRGAGVQEHEEHEERAFHIELALPRVSSFLTVVFSS